MDGVRTDAALMTMFWELTQFQLGILLLACLSGRKKPSVGVVTTGMNDEDREFLLRTLADEDGRWRIARIAEAELDRRLHPVPAH